MMRKRALAWMLVVSAGAAFAGLLQPGGMPPMGPGGGGGPMMAERKVVARFDKDGDGKLNDQERKAAREELKKEGGTRRGPGGPGGRGGPPGGGGGDEKPSPGIKVSKDEVQAVKGGLFDPAVLRTMFIDFDGSDWEDELSDFAKTDVEVPATLTVDGRAIAGVGVSFRGASSLFMVGKGSKRSLNLSLDLTDRDARIEGEKTLNLLNAHEDASLMHTVLYFHIAEALKVPAPRANFVRAVINGENWGLYTNAEQFGKPMLARVFPEFKGEGTRWKAPGSPMGRAGLEYLGEDVAEYKKRFTIKSKDDEKSWASLIDLCKTLNQTPIENLEATLAPKLDLDGVLWFLAIENVLVNSDGYWIRASDYNLYLDPKGVFHVLPHDANETLSPAGGPGMGGGPPGGGRGRPGREGDRGGPPANERPAVNSGQPGDQPGGGPDDRPTPERGRGGGGPNANVDPLVGLDDASKPLRSRLLKVPGLRAKYLDHVRTIAHDWLDWQTLGPVVEEYRATIDEHVKADTKKLSSYEAFRAATASGASGPKTIRGFAEQRRGFLLNHKDIKALDAGR